MTLDDDDDFWDSEIKPTILTATDVEMARRYVSLVVREIHPPVEDDE